MQSEKFLTKQKFSKMVEEMISEREPSYINAIVHLCEQNSIQIEDSKKYISEVIKAKVEQEARNLNFLPKNLFEPLE